MLEIMLSTGGSGGYFPNSGPGNKYLLKGNSQAGYFGQVSANELFDGYEVAKVGNLAATNVTMTGLVWLKFIYKKKILFIAKTPIQSGISWNDIYNAGFVYGERGNGNYPVGGGVDQLKLMSKVDIDTSQKWWLKVRLAQGLNVDPFTQGNGYGGAETVGTEWNDLMVNVASTGILGTGDWDNFTQSDLGMTASGLSFVKETLSSNLNYAGSRGFGAAINYVQSQSKTFTSYYWRPCLELTDVNGIPLVMEDAGGLLGGNLLDPILQNQDITDSAVRMVQITYDLSALVTPPLLKDEAFFNAATRITDVGSSISALSFFYPDASIVDPSLQIQALDSSISALSPFTAKAGYITDLADTIIPATDYGVFTVSP